MNKTPILMNADDWKTISLGLEVLRNQYDKKGDWKAVIVLENVKIKVDSHLAAAQLEESAP